MSTEEFFYVWSKHALMRAKRRFKGIDAAGLIRQARIASDDEARKIEKRCYGAMAKRSHGMPDGVYYLILRHHGIVYVVKAPDFVVTVFLYVDGRP